MNDSAIAGCLAAMGETDAAIEGMSKAIERNLFSLITDLMQLAAFWQEKEDNVRAKATYRFALSVLENCHCPLDLKVVQLVCCFSLATITQAEGRKDEAKAYIRQAVRTEMGKDRQEEEPENTFLLSKDAHQVIHTTFDGTSQVVMWLMAVEDEELLAVAKEELEK